jgi:hypothetical protein
MIEMNWCKSLQKAAAAMAFLASAQLACADEMSRILGAGCDGQYCSPAAAREQTIVSARNTRLAGGLAEVEKRYSAGLLQPRCA